MKRKLRRSTGASKRTAPELLRVFVEKERLQKKLEKQGGRLRMLAARLRKCESEPEAVAATSRILRAALNITSQLQSVSFTTTTHANSFQELLLACERYRKLKGHEWLTRHGIK